MTGKESKSQEYTETETAIHAFISNKIVDVTCQEQVNVQLIQTIPFPTDGFSLW